MNIAQPLPRNGIATANYAPVALLVLIVVMATLAGPTEAQTPWKGHDWLVKCSALLEQALGTNHPTCSTASTNPNGIKASLDAAGAWLDGLGFLGPAMSASLDAAHHLAGAPDDFELGPIASERDPRCVERYCAWLLFLSGKHGAYSWADSSLVLDPFNSDESGAQPGFDSGFGYAEVHELFHAVQAGYPDTRQALNDEYSEWILEGSADHVARAGAASLFDVSSGENVYFRTYDEPLHIPPTTDESSGDFRQWAYGSREFFEFLGAALGSPDGVGYLHNVLNRLRPDGKNGLLAVEEALNEQGESLHHLYPEFARRRLVQSCYFAELGTWQADNSCIEGGDNDYRFELAYPDTINRAEHTLPDLAVAGYQVRVTVPEGKAGLLTVRVPEGLDRDDLHLVVENERYDLSDSSVRNRFQRTLAPGDHEVFVRLVNAPQDLSKVVEDSEDFSGTKAGPIEFVLVAPFATITSGPGPSGADVDQPLGIALDSVPAGRLFNGAATRYTYDPSLAKPCVLGVGNLYNAQGDQLGFQMDHEGPIGPGDYTVADGRQIKYGDPLPPGQVNAGFVLGFLNQPPAQQLQQFVGIAGTLTVHEVAGRFLTATLDLTGENRSAPAIARGWEEPPANYLPGAVIRVELGLIMVDPADMAENSGAISCLTSEPKGGKGETATGSSGSPTDPAPGGPA